MCRLFGFIGAIDILPYIPKIKALAREHNDGWGIGYGAGDSIVVRKATLPGHLDPRFGLMLKTIPVELCIVHIRKAASCGKLQQNTQPFKKGRWVFSHNGTIDDIPHLRSLVNLRRVRGETGSELMFQLFLKNLRDKDAVAAIRATVNQIRDYSSLNALLTDGRKLYVLCEYATEPDHYALYYNRNKGIAIASEKLGDDWSRSENHQLQIIDRSLNIETVEL